VSPITAFDTSLLTEEVSLLGSLAEYEAPVWLLLSWIVVLGTVVPFAVELFALRHLSATTVTMVAMLEPVDEVAVMVPDDLVGTVMSDLSGRRGRVLGSEPVGQERTVVRAEVPQVEIVRYAVDLRSFSHGAATFTRKFVRYEPMPDNVAQRHLKD